MEDTLTLDSERRMWGSARSGLLRGGGVFKIWERMRPMENALVVVLVFTPTTLFTTQLRPENFGQTDLSVKTGRPAENPSGISPVCSTANKDCVRAGSETERIELGPSGTDLFPRIDPWVDSGLSLGRLGWAKDPGVSKPSSRLGGADNKGEVQRLPLMARIFLCFANAAASVFAGARHITVTACLRHLAVVVWLSSIDMRMSWPERGVRLSPVV